MTFPIFPFAPRRAAAVPVEVQRLSADNPISRVPPHGHLFFEILVITEGSGLIMVDGTVHTALPGRVFLIPPGMPHDARALGTATGWTLMFTSAGAEISAEPRLALLDDAPAGLVFDFFRRVAGGGSAPISLGAAELAAIVDLLERIEDELARQLAGHDVAIRAALNLIMVQIGRQTAAGSGDGGMAARDRATDERSARVMTTHQRSARDVMSRDGATAGRALLARVFEDIDLHFRREASLEAAARRLGMTPAHLTTRIRRLTGRTHGDWIIERRMIEARHRLVTTAESLAEIADAVGYRDSESFIRRFRAHHGITPARWRARALREDEATPQGA